MSDARRRAGAWVPALGLALALSWASACSSGGGPTGPVDGAGIEDISEAEIVAAADLSDLTDEQRARVREILESARAELRELRRAVRAGEIEPEAARERAREIHAETVEALSEILTEEQIEGLFDRLRDRRDDRPDLDLTEEQAAAIQQIRGELRETVQAIRAQVAAGELTGEEARALLRDAWVEAHAAICAVLTDEQAGEVRFCSGDPPPGPGGRGGPGPGGPPPGR